jgi:four helix bundle protein
MRLISVRWSSFPQRKWWSRRVTLPHKLACKASALLVCHGPTKGNSNKLARRPGAAPGKRSFGDSAALAGARHIPLENENFKMQNSAAMKHQDLQIRTKQFALEIIHFCESFPKDETSKILSRQLLHSGTSVGANYRAACRANSKPAFISKMGDVLEEADESGYWIELLSASGKTDLKAAAPLLNEANELTAIFISSINTAKRNAQLK